MLLIMSLTWQKLKFFYKYDEQYGYEFLKSVFIIVFKAGLFTINIFCATSGILFNLQNHLDGGIGKYLKG